MAYGDTVPTLNGYTLPRANGIDESYELTGAEIMLANGARRRQSPGRRFRVEISWTRLTAAEVTTIAAAADVAAVGSYVHVDGVAYVVLADPPTFTPIPATSPVRFDGSLSVSEISPRT